MFDCMYTGNYKLISVSDAKRLFNQEPQQLLVGYGLRDQVALWFATQYITVISKTQNVTCRAELFDMMCKKLESEATARSKILWAVCV